MSRSRTGGNTLPIPTKIKRSYRRQLRAAATDAVRNDRDPERDRRSHSWRFW